MEKSKKLLRAVCIVTAVFFCGCLGMSVGNEDSLREKVEHAWQAKVKGDWLKVYAMTTESFKKKTDSATYAGSHNVNVESFAIKELKIEEKEAVAVVRYEIKQAQIPLPFNLTIKESWQWEKGEWRLNPKKAKKMDKMKLPGKQN